MPETHTERGFAVYASKITTDYGHHVSFHESSRAVGRWAWLTVWADEDCRIDGDRGQDLAAHVSEDQARALYDAIGEWLGLTPAGAEPEPEERSAHDELVDFLRAMSAECRKLVLAFPPGCRVKALPDVRFMVPAPDVVGTVGSYFEDGSIGVLAPMASTIQSPTTGAVAEEGELLSGACNPDQLRVVGLGPVSREEVAAAIAAVEAEDAEAGS